MLSWNLTKKLKINIDSIAYQELDSALSRLISGQTQLITALCVRDVKFLLILASAYRGATSKQPYSWPDFLDWLSKNTTSLSKSFNKLDDFNPRTNPTNPKSLQQIEARDWKKWRQCSIKVLRKSHRASKQTTSKAFDKFVSKKLFKSLANSAQKITTYSSRETLNVSPHVVTVDEFLPHSQTVPSNKPRISEETVDTQLHTEKMKSLKLLAYGASHEINNPLANISIRAETLAKTEPNDERRKKLLMIQQQAMRAHQMISDLMLFAHPPSLLIATSHLGEVAKIVIDECRDSCISKAIELDLQIEAELTPIEIDAKQIQELLNALITNAMQAIAPNSGRIRVNVSRSNSSEQVIRVMDSGQGIAKDILPSIFDPFFSGREAGRGLGFGLSKAWRIADDHGGCLECISSQPGNTIFELRLQSR